MKIVWLTEYYIFLPDRFSKMTQPQIDILVKTPNINFIYLGKDSTGVHQLQLNT
jgi:hypothetical protein